MDRFENIPHIYYINLEERTDLREYTEQNLINIGISNFTRVSNLQFRSEDFARWRHLVYNDHKVTFELQSEISQSILYIDTIKRWLENTTEKYMIIMPDHIDYSYVEYFYDEWNWDYFMKNIPHDFDSILLGFEDKLNILPCFLHPMRDSHGTGMTLLNRKYAEKLVKFHYVSEKYNFFQKISNRFWKNENWFNTLTLFYESMWEKLCYTNVSKTYQNLQKTNILLKKISKIIKNFILYGGKSVKIMLV